MSKLYFRYGAVSSAKTLNLLAVYRNYEIQGKRAVIAVPKVDTRFGEGTVKSRAGMSAPADILISGPESISNFDYKDVSCILVDEAQFLSIEEVEALYKLCLDNKTPVIAYGLRTNFKTELFIGSKRFIELADSIEEIKTTCWLCQRKALFNGRYIDNNLSVSGEEIVLGGCELYKPLCKSCYHQEKTK